MKKKTCLLFFAVLVAVLVLFPASVGAQEAPAEASIGTEAAAVVETLPPAEEPAAPPPSEEAPPEAPPAVGVPAAEEPAGAPLEEQAPPPVAQPPAVGEKPAPLPEDALPEALAPEVSPDESINISIASAPDNLPDSTAAAAALALAGPPVQAAAPQTAPAQTEPPASQPSVQAVSTGLGREEFVPGLGWRFYDTQAQAYVSGFQLLPDGRTVYYSPAGYMQFGAQVIGNMAYQFDQGNGNLLTQGGEVFQPGLGWTYFDRDTAEYRTGLVTLPDGRTVYYGSDCAMLFGEQIINGLPVRFDTGNGNLLTQEGEHFLPGLGWTYFSRAKGQYVQGTLALPDGRIVYYGSDYAMRFGPQNIDGMPVLFDASNGNVLTQEGEYYLPGRGWTYFDRSKGQYVKGVHTLPDGRIVGYGDDYAMLFGNVDIGGLPYSFNPSNGNLAAAGERFLPGKGWAYLNPTNGLYAANGFTSLPDGRTVFYGDDAIMRFGFVQSGGNTFFMKHDNGNLHTGYLTTAIDSTIGADDLYLFSADGHMFTGWKQPDETFGLLRYYLPGSGKLATGWQIIDNSYYYFWHGVPDRTAPDGRMFTGWLQDAGDWYFIQDSGFRAAGDWVDVNLPLADFGRFCFFDSGGILRDSHTPFPHVDLPHNPNGIDCIFGTLDEVALAPTCRSEGRVVYRCNDNCGLTSTFFIAAVPHDYVLASDGKYYCKHCGQPMP